MFEAQERGRAVSTVLTTFLTVLLLLVLLPAPRAEAGLAGVGPVDPDTEFPVWMEDESGLRLAPCFDGPNCSKAVPDDRRPPSTPDNIGDRITYWSATAALETNGGGSASLELATTGGFMPHENPTENAQQIVNRIKIRADNLRPGATYEVTHPYGVETFTNVAGGPRGIDFTEEVGCLQAPCGDFSTALNGRVGPWLTWDTAGNKPPAGYVGDPSILHKVTGSPMTDAGGNPQDYFKIEGPDVGGPGVDTIRTALFSLEGKVSGLAAFASPAGGTHDTARLVSLTASDPRAEIFYTTDGTNPTQKSTPYTEPFRIKNTTTLKFLALVPNETRRSPVFTETYEMTES